jgi:hypothetical protein
MFAMHVCALTAFFFFFFNFIPEDRHWPINTPFSALAGHFPCPVVALRTLKVRLFGMLSLLFSTSLEQSELACGITAEQEARARVTEKEWMVSGNWGVVQFCDTAPPHTS